MKCIVVTPEKTEVETDAVFVAIPLFDGEYGVAPLHTPMVGRLGSGELRVKKADGSTDRYFIAGGFVEVSHDLISVLTNRLLRPSDLTSVKAQQAIVDAQVPDAKLADKEFALRSARAQLRVAKKWEAL